MTRARAHGGVTALVCAACLLALVSCRRGGSAPAPTLPAEPWVQRAPGGRYFQSPNGEPFLVMGNQPGTGFLDLPDDAIEAHFRRMQSFGETVARLDLDYAYLKSERPGEPARYLGLESSLGQFDPARLARIDKAFELAKKHDVRLLIVPFVTSPPMWETWDLNPYGRARGGPAKDPFDFMVSGRARQAFGERLDFISRRWGHSTTFFGWDLMNESNILGSEDRKDPNALRAWIDEIGARVAGTERAAFGAEHPRMVSWSELIPPEDHSFLFDSPALNVASTHPYELYGTTPDTFPKIVTSVVEPALGTHAKIRKILSGLIKDRRPYLENERHQNNLAMYSFYREADHAMAWAELVAGAAGTGLTWMIVPQGSLLSKTLLEDRHQQLGGSRKALAEVVRTRIPREFFLASSGDEATDAVSSSDAAVKVLSLRRGENAIAWMVGLDERCIQVEGVNETRQAGQAGSGDPRTLAFGLLLWRKLLLADGAQVDDKVFQPLLAAYRAKDVASARVELPKAFAYLEGLERAAGALQKGATCPSLSPSIQLAMPRGEYRVDWLEDSTGRVLRSDVMATGSATLTAPSFTRHAAVVVARAR